MMTSQIASLVARVFEPL